MTYTNPRTDTATSQPGAWSHIPLGVDAGQRVVATDLRNHPHQLIAGLIDAGTDQVLTSYAGAAAARGHEIAVLDVLEITGALRHLEDTATLATIGVWTPPKKDPNAEDPTRDAIEDFLRQLRAEVTLRTARLSEGGVTDWLHQKEESRLTPMTVLIADLPTVLARSQAAELALTIIAWAGPTVGIHLVATAQYLSESFIPHTVKHLFDTRTLVTAPAGHLLEQQLIHTFGNQAAAAGQLLNNPALSGRAITNIDGTLTRIVPAARALRIEEAA